MDYELLKLIWWLLIGILFTGLFLIESLELGAGVLMPFMTGRDARLPGKVQVTAASRGVLLVWLATVGGTLSMVWPKTGSLPGLATGLVALLVLLRRSGLHRDGVLGTVRPLGALLIGLLPALLFGIVLGNLFLVLPFSTRGQAEGDFPGALPGLFSPFALLAGLVSVSLHCQLGAAWLMLRGEGAVYADARRVVWIAGGVFVASFAAAVLWSGMGLHGYGLSAVVQHGVRCSQSHGIVLPGHPSLHANCKAWVWAWWAPLLAISAAALALFAASRARAGLATLGAGLTVCATVCSVGLALFPFIAPSSVPLSASLTEWNTVGSEKTLGMMLIVASVLAPMLLAYTLGACLQGGGGGGSPMAWLPNGVGRRGGVARLEGHATPPCVISK